MVSLIASTDSLKGKPHYRRTQQVYAVLDTSPADATYDRLIEYVRVQTGKGCSRKLISKWKKTFSVSSEQLSVTSKLSKNGQDKSDNNNTNVLLLFNSSEHNSFDSSFTELIPEITKVESSAESTVELLENQVNASIIDNEDKPDITHKILLSAEEETNDILKTGSATKESANQELLKRLLINNTNNDSLVNSDNDLSPIPDNEKTLQKLKLENLGLKPLL